MDCMEESYTHCNHAGREERKLSAVVVLPKQVKNLEACHKLKESSDVDKAFDYARKPEQQTYYYGMEQFIYTEYQAS